MLYLNCGGLRQSRLDRVFYQPRVFFAGIFSYGCVLVCMHMSCFLFLFLLFVVRRRNLDTPLLHMFAFAGVVGDVVIY